MAISEIQLRFQERSSLIRIWAITCRVDQRAFQNIPMDRVTNQVYQMYQHIEHPKTNIQHLLVGHHQMYPKNLKLKRNHRRLSARHPKKK